MCTTQTRAHDRVKSAVVAIPPSSPVQTPRGVPQSPPTTTGAVPNKGGGSSSLTQRPKQSKDTTQTVNSPPQQSPHPLPTAVRTVQKREVFMPGKAQTGNSSTHTSEDRSRQTSAVRSHASGGQCQEESTTAAKRRNRNRRRRKAAQKAQSRAPDTLVAQSVCHFDKSILCFHTAYRVLSDNGDSLCASIIPIHQLSCVLLV